jgi:hypothetical protein
MEDQTLDTQSQNANGLFAQMLYRNNAKIRQDRALSIIEDAQLKYRRHIEDLLMRKRKLELQRQNALDLSPRDAQSLVLAGEFDSTSFVQNDIAVGKKIRAITIELDIAKASYENLFGEVVTAATPGGATVAPTVAQ